MNTHKHMLVGRIPDTHTRTRTRARAHKHTHRKRGYQRHREEHTAVLRRELNLDGP